MNKVIITSIGQDMDSAVSSVFGRCQYFLVIDEAGKLEKAIPNAAIQVIRGAGIAAAQTVVNEGAQAVITGNIGPNAFDVLKSSGIRLYNGVGLTVKQAMKDFKEDRLSEITASSGRFGPGRGMGRGMGGGFGRRL